jgi:hypothetical protein
VRFDRESLGGRTAIGVISSAACALMVLAPTAGAFRPATTAQRHAIRRVVKREWDADASHPCPIEGPESFVFRGASISTVDPRFAQASVDDSGCTFTLGYVLRRPSKHGGGWRIVEKLLDSAQDCHSIRRHVPESVIRDFGIEGVLGPDRGIGEC